MSWITKPNVHHLKIWPMFYADVKAGRKRWELRINDRYYAVGDFLVLEVWHPVTKKFTGEKLRVVVRETVPKRVKRDKPIALRIDVLPDELQEQDAAE